MLGTYWPFFDIRIKTPSLELRVPTDDDLLALAELLRDGVHADDQMPFNIPWTRAGSPERERGLLQYHWRIRAELEPDSWALSFAVVYDGKIVGVQDINAGGFAVRRTVGTGSWLGLAHQGRGIGKEMRAAMLYFAFAGLGAEVATTDAFFDNAASNAVSRRLGYEDNGIDIIERDGVGVDHLRYRMTRARWEETAKHMYPVTLHDVEPCVGLLGSQVKTGGAR